MAAGKGKMANPEPEPNIMIYQVETGDASSHTPVS